MKLRWKMKQIVQLNEEQNEATIIKNFRRGVKGEMSILNPRPDKLDLRYVLLNCKRIYVKFIRSLHNFFLRFIDNFIFSWTIGQELFCKTPLSVPADSLFSVAEFIQNEERNRLNPHNLEKLTNSSLNHITVF
ncbi:hypothetical protein BpHYR1_042441 [Brachionus plicatilis]|uniref:Uncharacterized protein n=1 Tax=Brachionus plicatilis TaxID=10195 RepID=A0A3M7QWL2_BRAPC|nr:hypothetical protein BpHYR1_042441 [Brachionus plicatilis]